MKHLWRHACHGNLVLQTFDEAFVLSKVHRSKDDMEWTESYLRLRDFEVEHADYLWWRQHDLDRGHLDADQKAYFENEAVWLCALRRRRQPKRPEACTHGRRREAIGP